MVYLNPLKSGTAAMLALTITSIGVVPIVTTTPAFAQSRFPQREQVEQRTSLVLPSGTTIPVKYKKDKVVLTPDETVPLTLTVARNITGSDGKTVIPEGSEIIGELRPVSGGTQFVAKELTVYMRRQEKQSKPFPINGTSYVVTRMEEVKQGTSANSIIKGAAIGGAAAAVISAITGDRAIATEELLGGAGLGALGGLLLGNKKQANLRVVYPDQDLTVRLNSQFAYR
ncbi:MAG: hypothetical protein U7123_21680 [Potamolinea sp.]